MAQEKENKRIYGWAVLGVGYGTIGPSLQPAISVQFKQHLFTIKYQYSEPLNIFGGPINYSFSEAGLLYGISTKRKGLGFASFSAGLSRVYYYSASNKRWIPPTEEITIGIPVESQLFLRGKILGVGLVMNANFSSVYIHGSVLLCMQIGLLR